MQIVNEGYQVFDKATGSSVLGPNSISSIWSGFGGACQTGGAGDPVVLYDHLANRWVISQFASATGGTPMTDECVAVSTTGDATGTYNRYGFHLGTNFFDYPHLGVWPDAYYMSMNVFNAAGTAYLGPQPFAFDRTAMLAGSPATFISPVGPLGSSVAPFLPSDLDGSTFAAAGTRQHVRGISGNGQLQHFIISMRTSPHRRTRHLYDFRHSGSSGLHFALPHHPLLRSRVGSYIGEQTRWHWRPLNVPAGLSEFWRPRIGGRQLHRQLWRGGRRALVRAAQCDGWTGDRLPGKHLSARHDLALDGQCGDGRTGKSGHRLQRFQFLDQPADPLRGRLATDPINTLAQGEAHLFDGTGSQTGTGNRWGDYSDLTIDPVDDTTFWYTNEYYDHDQQFQLAHAHRELQTSIG